MLWLNRTMLRKLKIFLRSLRFEFKNGERRFIKQL